MKNWILAALALVGLVAISAGNQAFFVSIKKQFISDKSAFSEGVHVTDVSHQIERNCTFSHGIPIMVRNWVRYASAVHFNPGAQIVYGNVRWFAPVVVSPDEQPVDVGKLIGRGLPGVSDRHLREGCPVVFPTQPNGIDTYIGSQLPLITQASFLKGLFGNDSGTLGFANGVASGPKRLPQKDDCPYADDCGNTTQSSHEPLRVGVATSNILPDPIKDANRENAYGVLRFLGFLALAFVIMPAAARFSGRDWGRSALRFYGGLIGGLGLWFLSGVLIFALT